MDREPLREILIPEIEEKPHRKWKAAVGIAFACIVVPAVIAVVLVKAYFTEERALIKGFQKLAQEMKERQELWDAAIEASGMASGDAPANGPDAVKVETSFNLSAEELPFTLGIDTVLLRDAGARKLQASTELSVMNNKLVQLEAYGEDETVILALPALWQQNFAFDAQRIDEQYNASLLAQKWGRIENQSISVTLFPEEGHMSWKEAFVHCREGIEALFSKRKDSVNALPEVSIERLAEAIEIQIPERDNKQYQCSQYRVTMSDVQIMEEKEEITLLIAVDENDRIVQISLEEPLVLSAVELTGSIWFCGEGRSIDDIVVSMQMELSLDALSLEESTLSLFGNMSAEEMTEKKIELQMDAGVVYDENDTGVVTNLDKLTVSVDSIGALKVSGQATVEPLREEIGPLEGEIIRIFEITEEQYEALEQQLVQKLWRWSIAYKMLNW